MSHRIIQWKISAIWPILTPSRSDSEKNWNHVKFTSYNPMKSELKAPPLFTSDHYPIKTEPCLKKGHII